HLGMRAHQLQSFGVRLVVNQKSGRGLIPPEPDGGGLRHAAQVHHGEPGEILFLHAAPHALAKGCAVIWKVKGHCCHSKLRMRCQSDWLTTAMSLSPVPASLPVEALLAVSPRVCRSTSDACRTRPAPCMRSSESTQVVVCWQLSPGGCCWCVGL